MEYVKELLKYEDKVYGDFQCKLTPGIDRNNIIGVRVPVVRKLAKTLINDINLNKFFIDLPHKFYDENMLHGLLISEIKDYDECIKRLDEFLPYVDNWAVCDIMSPKVFKKNKDKLIIDIKRWINLKNTYTIRFGIEMLMSHYLNDYFKEEYLILVSRIKSDEYYIKMMIAWFFATALAKQWESTIKYIESKNIDSWTHNKIIQKARESYRITNEQKEYLLTLKQ